MSPHYHPIYFLALIGFVVLVSSCRKEPADVTTPNETSDEAPPDMPTGIGCHCANPVFSSDVLNPTGPCGALGHPGSSLIGGGNGYPNIVSESDATIVVHSTGELFDAVENASPGAVIYLDPTVTFDLTGAPTLTIHEKVTLASSRGVNGSLGARIIDNDNLLGTDGHKKYVLSVEADSVRITGIRVRGPHPDIATAPDQNKSNGIRFTHSTCGEVDNCDVSAFGSGGIVLSSARHIWVHHNHIHKCRRNGLGYGVVLYGDAEGRIEANDFELTRHAIAGSGEPGQSYAAFMNIAWSNNENMSCFDMHCAGGSSDQDDCTTPLTQAGGERIVIASNTFMMTTGPAIKIRGRPVMGCRVVNNSFPHSSEEDAVQMQPWVDNMQITDNCTGNVYHYWFVSHGATGSWIPYGQSNIGITALRFGDFNGDGKSDAFCANGSQWKVSYGAINSWEVLNNSALGLNDMAFGDFDGDGRTDVFKTTGSEWKVSYGGTSSWTHLNTSVVTLDHLAFGDFNGDGITDVMQATGSLWQVSEGGSEPWSTYNTSQAQLHDLRFGDFNGDGRTDAFTVVVGEWLVAEGLTSDWEHYNASSYPMDQMRFGDFNGDGRTDIFRAVGGMWYVNEGASSAWIPYGTSGYEVDALGFADFNGDGRTDVIRWQ